VNQLERLQRNQIIEPSCSPFAANCRLVQKKNGKQRLLVNYIPHNRVAIRDQYPLIPLISDIMGCLSGKKVFSTLDATEGFHQIGLNQKSRESTAFITPIGLYHYCRVPFGFINSPAIFQRAINEILRPGLFSKCVAYVDDILIFGKDAQEHDRNLQWVLDRCRMFNLKINSSKCQIGETSIVFLGRKISEKGMKLIEPDSDVLDPSAQAKTKSEVRAILDSLQFLARLIPRFSEITKPLVNLTRKDSSFLWDQVHQEALQTAWSAIRDAKVSAIPERHTPKVVHLYVLPQSIEAVCEDEGGKLIDRASHLLADSEQNYTTVEKTLLALVLAAVKFETFLDSSATVFTCESKETIKQIQQVHRARRVERLLIQVPPIIEVRMQRRDTTDPATAMLYAEQPPDAILYADGAAIANGKPTCRAGGGGGVGPGGPGPFF